MNRDILFQAIVIGTIIGLFLFLGILVDSELNNNYSKISKKKAIVTKIIDGDTIIVEGGEKVRLLGIDCDEKGKKCYTPAANFLESELLDKTVKLETEGKDIYDRTLAYVFLDSTNINVEIVEKGYCVARFEGKTQYQNEIKSAESYAIENKIGCKWS